ncbi:hypothetical protein [Arthrobacter sp. B10-11]|uniref:hypothetical protein n=1 Tax=Arthrobacter sp. B10-11 TaxID=3081160 RepID=UPI002954E431|nr:hypothetical protein [Arthrobacter sp. B10-11]MDV8147228.1 hypothetical protein [Arthrobacter sp. B10-11]
MGGAGAGMYALASGSAAAGGSANADAGALQETLPGARGGAQAESVQLVAAVLAGQSN